MAVQMQQQARTETPAQWNKALTRALNEALDVLTEPTSGRTFVESATNPGTTYEVTLDTCTCRAGARGVPCKHRATLLAQLGILPLDDGPAPSPEPPAPSRYRVVTPDGRLYSEHASESEAIASVNWLHRCYGDGGSSVQRIAA